MRFTPLVLILAISCPSTLPAAAGSESSLREQLLEKMRDGDVPGLAAAVLVDGETVWIDAMGTADFESGRPMTTDTILNIGSVSKLVTSSTVLKLAEQGKLDLDRDVSEYLGFVIEHPSGGGPITTRQLLTHTSGIQDGPAYAESYACGDPEVSLEQWLRGYLLPGGRYYAPENFLESEPGTAFEYTNVGYGLLGLVAEKAGGKGFSEVSRDLVFAPLGMGDSGWLLADVDNARLATPYWIHSPDAEPDVEEQALMLEGSFVDGKFTPFCFYGFYNYPDGLTRTTIEDLAKFAKATIPGRTAVEPLLSQETRQQIFRNQIPDLRTDGREQGFGWRRTDTRSFGVLWGHGGADPGIRAHILHRPGDGVTVIAMSNALVVEAFRPILELLFAEGSRHATESAAPPAGD